MSCNGCEEWLEISHMCFKDFLKIIESKYMNLFFQLIHCQLWKRVAHLVAFVLKYGSDLLKTAKFLTKNAFHVFAKKSSDCKTTNLQ